MRRDLLQCDGPQGVDLPKGQPCPVTFNMRDSDGSQFVFPSSWFRVEYNHEERHFCSPYCVEQWLETLWKPAETA